MRAYCPNCGNCWQLTSAHVCVSSLDMLSSDVESDEAFAERIAARADAVVDRFIDGVERLEKLQHRREMAPMSVDDEHSTGLLAGVLERLDKIERSIEEMRDDG